VAEITSLTDVKNLVNERITKTQASIDKLIAQKVCYVRNKALVPAIWAEEQIKQIRDERISQELADKAKIALDFAEKNLQKVNQRLSEVQTEINQMEAIQNRVLALIEGDPSYNTALFIDCSIVDMDTDLDSLIAQATKNIALAIDASKEGISVDVDIAIPSIEVPIPDVIQEAQLAAQQVGGIVGDVKRIKETQEEIEEAL
jgi:hypothetical protein